MKITSENVLEILKRVKVSGSKNIVSAGIVDTVKVEEGKVFIALNASPDTGAEMEPVRAAAEEAVSGLPGVTEVSAVLVAERHPQGYKPQIRKKKTLPGIRHIIAVASGKGGVGKSTVAANLAVALEMEGLKTGLMDADVYGPSAPRLMGITGQKPEPGENGRINPLEVYGIKVTSMGSFVGESTPMIWRGPMVTKAVNQFLYDVDWGELDMLVVDMPPGTGDAQLTIAQKVYLSGAVIVSTPQDIALIDARKGLEMFRRVDVPVLGLIENMSSFVCPSCGYESHIFGHDGARKEAEKLGCDFLGAIPLHAEIREKSDLGTPVTLASPQSGYAKVFRDMAKRIAAKADNVIKQYGPE